MGAMAVTAMVLALVALVVAFLAMMKASGALEKAQKSEGFARTLEAVHAAEMKKGQEHPAAIPSPGLSETAPEPPAPPKKQSLLVAIPTAAEAIPVIPVDEEDDSSYVNFNCDACGQNIDAPREMVGILLECPVCGKGIRVPWVSIPLKSQAVPVRPPLRPLVGSPTPALAQKSASSPVQQTNGVQKMVDPGLKGTTIRIDLGPEGWVPNSAKRLVTIRRRD